MKRLLIVVIPLVIGVAPHAEAFEGHSWDGSRATAVHRMPLVARDGQTIEPENGDAMPFSARYTCGSCHDYDAISGGFHFNSTANPSETRNGEPWVLVDTRVGTQLPISYRGWTGTWKPAEIGVSPWDFTRLFGRHLPGGDMAEPEDEFGDPLSRWNISGGLEVNCLGCHNGDPHQNQSVWSIQTARDNFAWAATAASGLGEVSGTAARLPDTWTMYDGPNPDDRVWAVPPSVDYDMTQFDSKGRAFFEVGRKPMDERCLFCHSASNVDAAKWTVDPDVHTAAGLQCTSCHRNGIDHDIVRGYETESADRDDSVVADFSCRGCHLGDLGERHAGGRLGAPRPDHKGLPPVHLDRLTCTVCHSGPRPGSMPGRVRTSRANRLGIHGKAQWYTDAPYIAEPVFVEGADGRIEPRRMMWPAFWARIDGDDVRPILPDDISAEVYEILSAQQQVGAILAAISPALSASDEGLGESVFLTPGKVYRRNVDGGLDVSDYDGATPVSGPGWAREQDGEILPLVQEFDPAEEELEFDVDARMTALLGALGPDRTAAVKPALCFGAKMYTVTPDDFIEVHQKPGDPVDEMTWGWLEDGTVSPLVPEFVLRAVVETAGIEESFTEEQVAMALTALADAERAEFAYISSGKMFRLDGADKLVASDHTAAEPYSWPMAHDVRPASESLGASSACTDCHTADSSFFFGTVEAAGPLHTQEVATTVSHKLQKLERGYTRLFGWSFTFRPLFKIVGFCASGLVLAVLLMYGFAGLGALCRWAGEKE